MLRVLWDRAVVAVTGGQPKIDLFEIGLPHAQKPRARYVLMSTKSASSGALRADAMLVQSSNPSLSKRVNPDAGIERMTDDEAGDR